MNTDVLYYFKVKNPEDPSPFIGSFAIIDCQDLSVENVGEQNFFENVFANMKDLTRIIKPDKGYEFKLQCLDREYHFSTDLITEMNKFE